MEHLEEKVRTWEDALPEQLRAVGPRDEQAAAVPHSALDDVPTQRVVLPRFVVPGQEVAQARIQIAATVRVRGPAEVWHNGEPVAQDLYVAGPVHAPRPRLHPQRVDALAIHQGQLRRGRRELDEEAGGPPDEDDFSIGQLLQSGFLFRRQLPAAQKATGVFEDAQGPGPRVR